MRPIKCENGHHYDADKYSECPHCKKVEIPVIASVDKDKEKKKSGLTPPTINPDAFTNIEGTIDLPSYESVTRAIFAEQDVSLDQPTQVIDSGNNKKNKQPIDIEINHVEKEVVDDVPPLPKEKKPPFGMAHVAPKEGATQVLSGSDIDPTVGFLVAVEGPHFGEAFVLHEGKNAISRSIGARIQLNKDNTVSRKPQLYIIFDSLNNEFIVTAGESESLAYVNSVLVLQPIKLQERSLVKVGNSLLMFLPFITADFTWQTYTKREA